MRRTHELQYRGWKTENERSCTIRACEEYYAFRWTGEASSMNNLKVRPTLKRLKLVLKGYLNINSETKDRNFAEEIALQKIACTTNISNQPIVVTLGIQYHDDKKILKCNRVTRPISKITSNWAPPRGGRDTSVRSAVNSEPSIRTRYVTSRPEGFLQS